MMDRRWRLLIVDDEPNNLQLMRQILEDKYQLSFATNGMKALELTKKIEPDLILLDIMMPDMDGYEVCKRLKADPETNDVPVIFITAKTDIQDEAKGLELGAIDYLAKPISPSIAKARIKNHLELKLARESIEKKNKKLEELNMELLESARLKEDVERITRHDLKTPLNAVIVFPRIMMDDKNFPKEYMEYLQIIEESGLTMLNMINLSLDLFKMERGIYEFQPDFVDILEVIKKIMNEMDNMAKSKELFVDIRSNGNPEDASSLVFDSETESFKPSKKNFLVWGEKLLCYSMLANLIKNAFEASPKGEKITIRLTHEKNTANISIHNKGSVPEDIRDRFFDKYATSKRKSGTGLGTYSARLITETQNGGIHLDTSEEEGTRVTIQLPRTDSNC